MLTNTVVGPGSDAAVLRVKETAPRAIALATDGDGVKTYLDPFVGGALAVAEACRNVACSGARPIAVTDCLNFGNPERLDVYFQLAECVRGMAAACEALGVPVVSGNVSLYNESDGAAIYPTPVVGALGLIDDVAKAVPMGFQGEGDAVYLVGADSLTGEAIDLAGSEYLRQLHGLVAVSEPHEAEPGSPDKSDRVRRHTSPSACLAEGFGFSADELEITGRRDAALFGERASRVVVSVAEARAAALESLLAGIGVPYMRLGLTGGDRLRLGSEIDAALGELRRAYEGGLEAALRE